MFNLSAKDYRKIFIDDMAMIDLRAPVEFIQGAFPQATNLPLLKDQERTDVGICYKKKGQQEAIKLGHQLVTGSVKQQRVDDWKSFIEKAQDSAIYCFRGGLRSRISQQWLKEAGVEVPMIEGGYKALRRFLIDETEQLIAAKPLYLLSGYTGSAKTKVLQDFSFAVDLEGLANHRGSSFGARLTAQPSQIDFENRLAIELIKHHHRAEDCILLEDEGRMIGSRSIPPVVKQRMENASLIYIDEHFEYRVEQIFQDYVIELYKAYEDQYREQSLAEYSQFLVAGCSKIAKRLGGENFSKIIQLIEQAIKTQSETGNCASHKDWIVFLLNNYYDPMYRYQIANKQHRIIFKGNTAQVTEYLQQLRPSAAV